MTHYSYLLNKIFLGIVIIASCIGFTRNSAGQENDAVYFYYYSVEKSAFIVENIHGNEQHILAEFNLSPDTSYIAGPGWSPSGQWFAWYEALTSNPLFVVHRDSQDSINSIESTSTQHRTTIQKSEWSNTHDILSTLRTEDPGVGIYYFEFIVIDIANNETLFEFSKEFDPALVENSSSLVGTYWDTNGEVAYIYYTDPASPDTLDIYAIASDGKIINQSIFLQDATCGIVSSMSPDGKFYQFGDSHQIIALADNVPQLPLAVDEFLRDEVIHKVEWNHDGKYAFVFTQQGCDETEEFQLWLLSALDTKLYRLNIVVFESKFAQYNVKHWSPDGLRGWFIPINEELVVVETANDQSTIISTPAKGSPDTTSIIWSSDSQNLYFIWEDEVNTVFEYNIATQELTSVVQAEDTSIQSFSVSPSEMYLMFFGLCLGNYDAPCLADLTTQAINPLNPNSAGNYGSYGNVVRWHLSEKWMLLGEFVEQGRVYIRLVETNGNAIQEIGYCDNSLVCFGWLPEISE